MIRLNIQFINTFKVVGTQHESEGICSTGGDSVRKVPPLTLLGRLHFMRGQVALLHLLMQVLEIKQKNLYNMFSDKIFLKIFKKNCGKHSSKIYVHLSMTVKMERKKSIHFISMTL